MKIMTGWDDGITKHGNDTTKDVIVKRDNNKKEKDNMARNRTHGEMMIPD
jgi:hypothetical protein